MNAKEMKLIVVRKGKALASSFGRSIGGMFDDSLEGDLARRRIRRELLAEFPDVRSGLIDLCIEETLEP